MLESDDDDDDDDDNDNDVEPLQKDFANIEEANKLLEAQTAIVFAEEDEYRLWRDKGATSNLRDRGNSRATYYKKKKKVEDLKSSAKECLDIRNFFKVQDEDEDSDDTIDEMEMVHGWP